MKPAEQLSRDVIRGLRAAGHDARLVGGCVRDHLLGEVPHDYDVATDAVPDRIERTFPGVRFVGRAFGVGLIRRGDAQVEVATYRVDGPYSDGRRPDSVRFATLAEDLARRDFTVNAMALDPDTGEVTDPFGGREDLAARHIRCVGDPDRRFAEDHLRTIRAARLAARLGFEIESATAEAARRNAANLGGVSAERIRTELEKMLVHASRADGMRWLDRLELLPVILPEVAAMKGVDQPPQFHPEGDVWIHTLRCLELLRDPSFVLTMATLLHDVGKPDTFERAPDRIRFSRHDSHGAGLAGRICERLRLSGAETEDVTWLVSHHMAFKEIPRMRLARAKRFFADKRYPDLVALARADAMGSHGDAAHVDAAEERRGSIPPEEVHPPPLLTGHDLIAMGMPPGPAMGKLLRELVDAQLDGDLRTREAAETWVRERLQPH